MKNNKGFMLAEVVITSTIVLTALITFYTTFNKLYKRYEIHSTYYDIDGVYAIKQIANILLEEGKINEIITDMNLQNKEYINVECSNLNERPQSSCNSIKELYNIENIYFVKNRYQSIKKLENDVDKNTFKDYLEYIIKTNSRLTKEEENPKNLYEGISEFIFVIEYKNSGNNKEYYSYLEFGGQN